jgi:hypothetical protein
LSPRALPWGRAPRAAGIVSPVGLTRDATRAIANSRAIERVYRGGVASTPAERLP